MDKATSGWVPFDPATGDWTPDPALPTPAGPAALPPDARRHGLGPTLWSVLLGIDIGLMAVALLYEAVSLLRGEGSGVAGSTDLQRLLWGQVVFNLLTLGLIPFAWVMGTRVRPWEGALLYLRLHHPGKGIVQGALWGLATLGGLVLLGYALKSSGTEAPNPQADALLCAMTPTLALALALSAGIGEEIFFRGLLQKRLGVWGQAIVFGLFHLSYGTPLQVIIPALLGLLYGFLVRRGAPLWVPITAHFLFDYVQLSSPFWLPVGMAC
ncbi:MAG TPA: type II CAAX endopeptidase family protein [Candidatus Thermoplasmatota archaeon]|nr:type II CAAX endopeptidase family protein [Candidatus Thermoplasmatota archaeon]